MLRTSALKGDERSASSLSYGWTTLAKKLFVDHPINRPRPCRGAVGATPTALLLAFLTFCEISLLRKTLFNTCTYITLNPPYGKQCMHG